MRTIIFFIFLFATNGIFASNNSNIIELLKRHRLIHQTDSSILNHDYLLIQDLEAKCGVYSFSRDSIFIPCEYYSVNEIFPNYFEAWSDTCYRPGSVTDCRILLDSDGNIIWGKKIRALSFRFYTPKVVFAKRIEGGLFYDVEEKKIVPETEIDSVCVNYYKQTSTSGQYKFVSRFTNGYAKVLSSTDKWGVVDSNFDVVIECRYDWIYLFNKEKDICIAERDSHFILLNEL